MERLVLELPALYADHHTLAVRRILQGLPGITDLYVSSAFHQISLRYDPERVTRAEIVQALEKHGYRPEGSPLAFSGQLRSHKQRLTAAVAGVGNTVAFLEPEPPAQQPPRMPMPDLDLPPASE